jgi:hypothetical protein
MSAEVVKDGQLVRRSSGSLRNWQRRACGSTPGACGFSQRAFGIITYCNLHEEVKIPVETVDEKTGELKKEVVSDVYCGAGEGVVTIAK